MRRKVVRHAGAERDLAQYFCDLALAAGPQVADRFLNAAEKSFQLLADMPKIGARRTLRSGRFPGLRMWWVKGFENYLIYYRPISSGVLIIRVLHSKMERRDYLR